MAASAPKTPTMGGKVVIFPLEEPGQISVVAVSIVFIIIPTLMVILRLIARRMAHRDMDLSDWSIIAGLVSCSSRQQ